jgi:hypothetical protein
MAPRRRLLNSSAVRRARKVPPRLDRELCLAVIREWRHRARVAGVVANDRLLVSLLTINSLTLTSDASKAHSTFAKLTANATTVSILGSTVTRGVATTWPRASAGSDGIQPHGTVWFDLP